MPTLDSGNTAWVLASSALVLLMTPGLAFFYGGMVRAKSVLNMLMMNFICIAVVTVAWVLYGWSVSFGNANDASGSGFWGGYFLSGGTLMASATRSFPVVAGAFLSLDARASASYVRIPVAHGHASVPNFALHLHAGLGYGFGQSESRRD